MFQCMYIRFTFQPEELGLWQKQLQFQPELIRI